MAAPRIFVSSTFYDLQYVREVLGAFISSLGYQPVLFEKGDIPFFSELPIEEYCYAEAEGADIFVLIIAGEYGTKSVTKSENDSDIKTEKDTKKVLSITQKEYERAYLKNIPIYTFIKKEVAAEYQIYQENKDNGILKKIKWKYSSPEIFDFINSIYNKEKNNYCRDFENLQQVQDLLKAQWAGVFQRLLRERPQQKQLSDLDGQVKKLMSLNEDMKPYLEQLLKNEDEKGEEALKRLQKEEEKRKKERQQEEFNKNQLVKYWKLLAFSEEQIKSLIIEPKGRAELVNLIKKAKIPKSRNNTRNRLNFLLTSPRMQKDYNDARKIFDLDSINFEDDIVFL